VPTFPTRRNFLLAGGAAATAGLVWSDQRWRALAQEAPPETTRVRIIRSPSLCAAPFDIIDELLADEGITQVDYVAGGYSSRVGDEAIASGQVDFGNDFSGPLALALDRGTKIAILAGVHVGCYELFAKPIATKRVVRAILRATDLCLSAPTRVARRVVDRGFTPNYDYAVQTFSDVPYGKWRDYDPEDTLRFYALRLHEAGMVKSSPDKIIAEAADWRFLREVRRELE
jgi:ABC-type nitrate/sulfonate/bicarbonate transport system substrate-binding protein